MRSVLRYGIFLLLIFFAGHLFAQTVQKEANIWYFGRFLGLDFNSGTAVPLNDGQLNTIEGVATISNSGGNLLFYTDGIKVWNKNHQVMPNGTGLFGDPSSSQSAVIVQKVGDTTRYYIFTVDQLSGPRGLNYSVVNMALAGGNGDVELKNVPVISNVVEKITAVKHCNNRDIWVVAHGSASDIYYSFLVTAAGVTTSPIISHTGVVLPGVVPPSSLDSTSLGYLKASPDGRRIAAAHWTVNADVSNFDNSTGMVSNTVSLFQPGDPHYLVYGIEFSPDSKLVYNTVFFTDPANGGKRNALYQYDVTLASPAAIRASKQVISQNSDPIETYAALQIAPDGKMYMAKNIYKNIASISSPNVYGPGCNFTASAIQWTGTNQESSFGLPTFVQSYFYPVDSFTHSVSCLSLTGTFNYTPASNVISVRWEFGDPASGANNISTINSPTHIFSAPGTYNVLLIKLTNCGPDTLRKQVSTDALNINLGADTVVCGATSLLLNSTAAGSTNTFLWQNGSTSPTLLATTSGMYWVEASNAAGCTRRDTINVTFRTAPVFNLGPDATICAGDSLTLNATAAGAISYLWSTGAVTPTIKAFSAGIYWCDVNNGGCTTRDSLTITAVIPKPIVNFGNDITTCNPNPITLDATNPNCTYLWQNGSTNATFNATTSGLYWAEVRNSSGCIKRDSINITFRTAPVFNLGADASICAGDSLTLNATAAGAISYLWSTGAATPTIKAFSAGLYWCEVSNGGCTFRDSLTITAVIPKPIVNLGNDITTCNPNPITLDATNPNSTYLWQNGSTNATLQATTTGLYWAEVRNSSGCIQRDSINITFRTAPVFNLGADVSICAGDSLTLNATAAGAISYLWSTGAATPTIKAFSAGLYWCEVSNGGCTYRDSLTITAVIPKPIVNLGNDITTCNPNPITLDATNPNSTYLWQNGSTNATLQATTTGLFWVEVRNNAGCTKRDSINIVFQASPVFNLGADAPICAGDTLTLNATATGAISYLWSTGAITPTIRAFSAGLYWCEVSNGGCVFRDSLNITAVVPKPVVNLGNDITTCATAPITLDATNPNCTYLWQNGSTNATLQATTTGLFWVEVRNNSGCTKRDSINITFRTSPVFNLGADAPICAGDSLTLNATVAGAISYLWSTGAITPTIRAFSAGLYWCEVSNGGCTFRDSLTITAVIPKPIVNLGNDISTCATAPITLDATNPNATYLWQNGSTNATLQASTTGLYWVEVRNNSGCTKRDSINIQFNPSPVFNLGNDATVCAGDSLTLNATATGAISYQWSTGAVTPTIKAFQAGLYWCQVSNGNCTYRDSLTILAVIPKPVVNLGNDITQCGTTPVTLNATNPNATYLWQDGSTNPTLQATATGLYWVEVKNPAGCTKRDSINIVLNPIPVFNLGADTPICAGDILTLNATVSNATSYLWNTGATTATINAAAAGTYWCEVTKAGCLFRDSLIITAIKPLPVVNLGNDITVCEGIAVPLDATYLNSTYRWQDGSTNPVFTVNQAGTYNVQVDYNGCKKSDTIVVNYNLKPRFSLGPDQLICQGNTITLSPSLNAAWQLRWQDGSSAPTFTVTQPGVYSLAATNNCGTTVDDVMIAKGLCTVFVPTAFTPNNDGKNDLFRALGTEAVTEFNLKIFNRAGQVVFSTTDKNKGWDGKLNGTDLSTAVFVYLISYKDIYSPDLQVLKGTLTLIR